MLQKNDKKVNVTIDLPSSKSISNRVLILQHFVKNIDIIDVSYSNDTDILVKALNTIDNRNSNNQITEINAGNAGTAFRFLTALLALKNGKWLLTGSERMCERPVKPLVDALLQLGANISYLQKNGFPPLIIDGTNLRNNAIEIEANISSQFISALLLIAPFLENGLTLKLKGKVVSEPYIKMTVDILKYFNTNISIENNIISIINQQLIPKEIIIEKDWSSASYWYEIAALSDSCEVILKGLKKDSLQGDSVVCEIFDNLGVETVFYDNSVKLIKNKAKISNINYDFTNCPDLALTIIVCCAALNIEGHFTGIESLRIKETDRIEALKNELRKISCNCEIIDNEFFIKKSVLTDSIQVIKTYDDHRMAMSFAPLAILLKDIKIENPNVVSKSYPNFWEDMIYAGFTINY